jgi:small-conductance mechanosensitive channel
MVDELILAGQKIRYLEQLVTELQQRNRDLTAQVDLLTRRSDQHARDTAALRDHRDRLTAKVVTLEDRISRLTASVG